MVLPRRSPLMELVGNPSVLGVLGMDAGPGDLSELLEGGCGEYCHCGG